MPTARPALLVVAVIAAGLSLGFAPVRADEWPADTNKIESLTPEQTRKLAEEFPGVEVVVESSMGIFRFHQSGCSPLNGLKSLN